MSYIGNPPVVQSSRLVYEETAATAKTAFTPPGGYTVGQLEVYINGSQLMSDDFTATDGSTVNLTTACAVGDGFKSIAYGNFLASNAVNKSGDTMTGPLTLGGLLGLGATGQIKFPATQNVSADANTLDDYEEGSWTPTLTCSSVAPTITSYSTRTGSYTKVGNLVTVTCSIRATLSAIGSGQAVITGLPFPDAGFLDGIAIGIRDLFSSAPTYSYINGSAAIFSSAYVTGGNNYITFTASYRVA